MEKYKNLKKEFRRLSKLRIVEIVRVLIGVPGSFSAEFDRWMGKLGITCKVMQKIALLGTARILRNNINNNNNNNNNNNKNNNNFSQKSRSCF